uniref:Centrin1b-fron-infraciliary-lattice n=1 Tax=Paramecium tetraurelia TaxID=5888 RepID=Q3SEK3_PARTE|nr:centrin1b-fron-infraciliary-lattice [Paramecium tetraurelia]
MSRQAPSSAQKVDPKRAPPPPPPAQKGPKAFNAEDYAKPPHLTKEEVLEVKQAFDIFDNDGSGSIDPQELREAFEASGIKTYHNKFIYQVLGELDTDNKFLHLATAKVSDKDTREQIQKVFNLYDWNKEGRITWDELKRVAQDLGEEMTDEEIQHMFKKADLDDDGFVTFDDFYNLMTQKEYGKQ